MRVCGLKPVGWPAGWQRTAAGRLWPRKQLTSIGRYWAISTSQVVRKLLAHRMPRTPKPRTFPLSTHSHRRSLPPLPRPDLVLARFDEVFWSMQRITVVGTTGSGKTIMAREISARLGIPYTHLQMVRLRTPREATVWLSGVGSAERETAEEKL